MKTLATSLLLVGAAAVASAAPKIIPGAPAPYTGTIQASQLYTAPSGPGGIGGRIDAPPSEVLGIFAISREKQKTLLTTKLLEGGTRADVKYRIAVHIAHLSPDDSFSFTGLQEGIYDLLVLLANDTYSGVALSRRTNTLTTVDAAAIAAKIQVSNPYFNEKTIARLSGTTGRAAKARALVQEVRTLPVTLQDASVRADIQTRSLKLFLLEEVAVTGAPAWSVEETRELVRQEVGPADTRGRLPDFFCSALSGIIVVDGIEELGAVKLSRDSPPETRQSLNK